MIKNFLITILAIANIVFIALNIININNFYQLNLNIFPTSNSSYVLASIETKNFDFTADRQTRTLNITNSNSESVSFRFEREDIYLYFLGGFVEVESNLVPTDSCKYIFFKIPRIEWSQNPKDLICSTTSTL